MDPQKIRQLLAHAALERYQKDPASFPTLWGFLGASVTVVQWTNWALNPLCPDAASIGLVGEAVALHMFAYHYKVRLFLHSTNSPAGPIRFRLSPENASHQDEEFRPCLHLAHAQWLANGRGVIPMWPRGVVFTPQLDEVTIPYPL